MVSGSTWALSATSAQTRTPRKRKSCKVHAYSLRVVSIFLGSKPYEAFVCVRVVIADTCWCVFLLFNFVLCARVCARVRTDDGAAAPMRWMDHCRLLLYWQTHTHTPADSYLCACITLCPSSAQTRTLQTPREGSQGTGRQWNVHVSAFGQR